jgi:hypothetical protein
VEVDVGVYPLIPAFGWTFKKGNDKSNLIHISSNVTPVIVKLGFHVINESSQVLRSPLKGLTSRFSSHFLLPRFFSNFIFHFSQYISVPELEGSPPSVVELESDGSQPFGLGARLGCLSGGLGGEGGPSPPGDD